MPTKPNRAVVPLNADARVHPQRLRAVRDHLLDRATQEDRPVAAVVVTVSHSGSVQSTSVGIEPEHAPSVIAALQRIVCDVSRMHSPPGPAGSVIALRVAPNP